MKIQRTIPLVVAEDADLLAFVAEYNRFQRAISEVAFNDGKPLAAVPLHKAVYYTVPSTLRSQMKCSAIRNVAGAYSSAKHNRRPTTRPFTFKRKAALFLFNKDFSFTRHGKLSISTSAGRKKLDYTVPDYAKADFENAVSRDAIVVTGANKITLCVTLEVPEPKSIHPVGIDLGVNNALVASTENDTLFVSGAKLKQANRKTRKTRQRLQKKLAGHKAQGRNTRSVRRTLKRLGRKTRNRNRTFCKETAAKLCKWAPADAILVFEDLRIKQVRKDRKCRKGTRRKLSGWFFNAMTQACISKAERMGLGVDYVDPAFTSQRCRKCGLLGKRNGHSFLCSCGHAEHADVNASHNVRLSYAVLRGGGSLSTGPEALAPAEGKPPALSGGR
jgi:IS605 OrfB family transposase